MNEFFDKIYCINLDKRTDRWNESLIEFEKLQLNVERVSAIDGSKLKNNTNIKNGALALTLTVNQIIDEAISENLNRILILEDDVIFTDKIKDFSDMITELPDDWDMVSFGGNHNTHCGSLPPIKVNDNFNKLYNTYSAHAIGISSSGLALIKGKLLEKLLEIDVLYAEIQKTDNVYCFSELLAYQRPSYSDIEDRVVNYNNLIK